MQSVCLKNVFQKAMLSKEQYCRKNHSFVPIINPKKRAVRNTGCVPNGHLKIHYHRSYRPMSLSLEFGQSCLDVGRDVRIPTFSQLIHIIRCGKLNRLIH